MPAPTASVSAPVAGDVPAEDSPLGFLAALVDQLLGNSPPQPALVTAEFGSDIAPPSVPTPPVAPIVPEVAGAPAAGTSPDAATAPVPGAELLAQLSEALSALAQALGSGQPVDPDTLKRANDAAEAVVNQLGVPLQAFVTPMAPKDDPFALAALPASKPEDADSPTLTVTPGAIAAPSASDAFGGLAATLATLLGVPSDAASADDGSAPSIPLVTASTSPTPPPTPLPALAALATRLVEVSKTVEAEAPDLAQKLEALGKVLNAAEAQPDLLRNLTTSSDTRGTELDKLVRSLVDARAVAAPTSQLAVPPPLKAPAEIIAAAATIDEAAAPPDADTAHVAQRLTLAATSAVTETARTKVSVEAKPDVAPAQAPSTNATEAAPPQNATPPAISPHAAPIARSVQSAYQPIAAQAGTVPQFAFEMVRQFHQGQSRFSIRLDPPELGRVDVKMHVDAAGNVNARLTVERAETLDMFQRDHRTLERAMAQAGLDSSKTSLEFSLRQNPFNMSGQGGQGGNAYAPSFEGGLDMAEDETAIPSVILYRGTASAGGVNLFV